MKITDIQIHVCQHSLDMGKEQLKEDILIDDEGYAHVPDGPGMGIDLDWDLIDNATMEIL